MALTTNKSFVRTIKADDATFVNSTGEPRVNIEGAVQLYNSDGDPMDSLGGGGGAGGGSIVYTNAAGDFVAVANTGTKTITITGLPFDLEDIHVVAGTIKKITTTGAVSTVDTDNVTVAAGVITLTEADDFVATDTVLVTLVGPDKSYDRDLDITKTIDQSSKDTDVEHIINESNLGITATSSGGDADTLTDAGETFTAETVAEGYIAYQVSDTESALVNADTLYGHAGDGGAVGGGASVETATLSGAATWDTKIYVLPECKRFEIPAEGYKHISIDVLLDSQDANNSCYCKIYATNISTADTTDDIYWKDKSTEIFGVAQLSADGIGDAGRVVTQGIFFIDTTTVVLKYMIKIVAENDDGTLDNEFNIRIKKSK